MSKRLIAAAVWLAAGCVCPAEQPVSGAPEPATVEPVERRSAQFVLTGAHVDGALSDVEIRDGRITAVGQVDSNLPRRRVSGWLTPAVIDAHVHLHYRPAKLAMARGGVAAALDLGAPLSTLSTHRSSDSLLVVSSGPIVTARAGYPTQSWGRDGYGLEIETLADADEAVDRLASRGARVVKIALSHGPRLTPQLAARVAQRAHARKLLVFAHALSDADAAESAESGADVLAHTPTEPLAPSTVALWANRHVVSTLSAFGGASSENLTKLRAAGATVVYGTDFGNTSRAGVSREEVAGLLESGMSPRDTLTAMTRTPAKLLALTGYGTIVPGARASMILTPTDPLLDPTVLAAPTQVWIDGRPQRDDVAAASTE